jgi:acetoacetyl-CoA reductase
MMAQGLHFHAYPCDVADFEVCRGTEAKVSEEVGPGRHARQQRRHHARHDVQEDGQGDWDAVMKTNLDSCFNMTKQVVRRRWSTAAGAA